MSGQHTPGRLEALAGGWLTSKGKSGTLGDGWVATAIIQEDARRLAACWNACESMTTEQIEAHGGLIAGLTVGVASDAAERIVADRTELAAARALLAEVLKEAEDWHDECHGEKLVSDVAERARAFLKGGA